MDTRAREEVLWKQALRGDRNALGILLDGHRGWMRLFALRLEGNEQDVSDLLQDVYLKVLESLEGFQGRSALKTWLYRILVNTFLDRSRKERVRRAAPLEETADRKARDPLQEEIAKETCVRVQEALENLPPKQRAVLALKVYEGLPYGEISSILGISPEAVKMNVLYARKKLAKILRISLL